MPMGGFRIWIRSSALLGTSVTHAKSEYLANCNLWAVPEKMRGKKMQRESFQKICFFLFYVEMVAKFLFLYILRT